MAECHFCEDVVDLLYNFPFVKQLVVQPIITTNRINGVWALRHSAQRLALIEWELWEGVPYVSPNVLSIDMWEHYRSGDTVIRDSMI